MLLQNSDLENKPLMCPVKLFRTIGVGNWYKISISIGVVSIVITKFRIYDDRPEEYDENGQFEPKKVLGNVSVKNIN